MTISIEKRNKLEELIKGLNIVLHFDETVFNRTQRSSRTVTVQELEENELCNIASNFKGGLSKGSFIRDEEKWTVIKWDK